MRWVIKDAAAASSAATSAAASATASAAATSAAASDAAFVAASAAATAAASAAVDCCVSGGGSAAQNVPQGSSLQVHTHALQKRGCECSGGLSQQQGPRSTVDQPS